jgi:hypothetical protein
MSQEDPNAKRVEAEVVPPDTSIATTQAATVEQLAQTEEGLVVLERGIEIMKVLRAASIALTYPHDWVLFKADDRITGYCQDAGCQRFSDIWGIEIYNLGEWLRAEDPDDKTFSWTITGDGMSKRTGQIVTGISGTRYSYEDFITKRRLPRLQVETEVKKAARANLHGSIVRELAGMKSVPMEELDNIWKVAGMGEYKTTKLSPKGRGFGTADERAGGSSDKNGGVDVQDIPFCSFCEPPERLVFRPEKKFWGCRNYKKHESDKMIIQHDVLLKQIADRKAKAGDAQA